jgi:cytidylate kinase
MYRGVTLFAMEKGMIEEDVIDETALEAALPSLELHFEHSPQGTNLFWESRCIEKEIRTMEVSAYVSPISALPFVRAWVDELLHLFSKGGRVVMDGRDIGTSVFPNAELKIFLTASPKVRVKRRYDELISKGQKTSYEEVVKNLSERDYIDSHRSVSPLRKAEDAFVLDNSDMTLHEEIIWLRGLIQGRFGIFE